MIRSKQMKSYDFLVIARPIGYSYTLNDMKVVSAFSVEGVAQISNKKASEYFMQIQSHAEIRKLKEAFGGDCFLECVPSNRWTF